MRGGWLVWRMSAALTVTATSVGAQEVSEASASEQAPTNVDEGGFEGLSLLELLNQPLPTGSFVGADVLESPMSVTVIHRDEIQASGARHLSELLEIYVPGFQYMINKWNGVIWGMRGVATDRNSKFIFLVNGHQLNLQASHGAYSETTLGLLDDIEQVEVLRGPAGMLYGSGSIAGVVNVITRTPQNTSADVKLGYGTERNPQGEASAHVAYGEQNGFTLSVGARKSNGHGDRAGRVYGNHEWPATGVPSADGNPVDGSPWQTPGNFRVSADWHHGELRVYARFTRQQLPTGQFFIVDPWPESSDPVADSAGPRIVDGRVVEPTDPLGQTESFGFNRRLHTVDSLAVNTTWQHKVGADVLMSGLAFAGTTDALETQAREGYGVPGEDPVAGQIGYSFGDKRFTTSLRYQLNRIKHLQFALGGEYRVDQIGKDMTGRNTFGGSDARFFVMDVVYGNLALYGEGVYELTSKLSIESGVRVDKHSRTDWIANPRAALLFFPAEEHAIKAIFQTSSNNGQADFYELDWASVTDEGQIRTAPYLEVPSNPDSTIIRPSTLEERYKLKPERAVSFELNSMHFLADSLTLSPSLSVTRISNLFTWNPDFFSTVNAGNYSFFSAEFEGHYKPNPDLHIGLNQAYTRILTADQSATTFTRDGVRVEPNGDGTYAVVEDPSNPETVEVNAVDDQISDDGRNLLNLSSNITKMFATFRPLSWWTLHSNARIFWGLPGRKNLYEDDIKAGYGYLDVENGAPIVKWNAATHFHFGSSTVGLYVFDILGTSTSRHAVRHQQSTAPVQRALYTVDQRAFYVSYGHAFR